jgi:hypothetical protein
MKVELDSPETFHFLGFWKEKVAEVVGDDTRMILFDDGEVRRNQLVACDPKLEHHQVGPREILGILE